MSQFAYNGCYGFDPHAIRLQSLKKRNPWEWVANANINNNDNENITRAWIRRANPTGKGLRGPPCCEPRRTPCLLPRPRLCGPHQDVSGAESERKTCSVLAGLLLRPGDFATHVQNSISLG